MEYSEAHLAALQNAVASGVQRVSYDGKTVEYRSMAELREALAEVRRGLAAQAGRMPNRRVKVYAEKEL